jgi:hypothetical protein
MPYTQAYHKGEAHASTLAPTNPRACMPYEHSHEKVPFLVCCAWTQSRSRGGPPEPGPARLLRPA